MDITREASAFQPAEPQFTIIPCVTFFFVLWYDPIEGGNALLPIPLNHPSTFFISCLLLLLSALDVHSTFEKKSDSTRSPFSVTIVLLPVSFYVLQTGILVMSWSPGTYGRTKKLKVVMSPPISESESDLPTNLPQETCLRRGLCPVSRSVLQHGRPTAVFSHSIYYEQHGVPGTDPVGGGDDKVVFVMGLNSSCSAWGPQVQYFGGRRGLGGSTTTALVFDHRGVGNSGYPRGPYS